MNLRSRSVDDLYGSPYSSPSATPQIDPSEPQLPSIPPITRSFSGGSGGNGTGSTPYNTTTSKMMTSSARKGYLFRAPITFDPLYAVLTACSYQPNIDWFQVDANVFRKMVYKNLHLSFLRDIRDWYYPAKWRKYGDKPITFTSFTTIIRQMCKQLNHEFSTKIVYDKSVCNTVYFVCRHPKTSPSSPIPPIVASCELYDF